MHNPGHLPITFLLLKSGRQTSQPQKNENIIPILNLQSFEPLIKDSQREKCKQSSNIMVKSTILVLLLATSSSNAFQFMSNWKITPPQDLEKEAQVKAKFGDKSKLHVAYTQQNISHGSYTSIHTLSL